MARIATKAILGMTSGTCSMARSETPLLVQLLQAPGVLLCVLVFVQPNHVDPAKAHFSSLAQLGTFTRDSGMRDVVYTIRFSGGCRRNCCNVVKHTRPPHSARNLNCRMKEVTYEELRGGASILKASKILLFAGHTMKQE